MQKIAHIDCYKFKSFSEMLEFLKANWKQRRVRFGKDELCVFVNCDGTLGSNADTFKIVYDASSEDPEVGGLEYYFDENDQPMEEKFAEDFNLDDFTGEEYIKE